MIGFSDARYLHKRKGISLSRYSVSRQWKERRAKGKRKKKNENNELNALVLYCVQLFFGSSFLLFSICSFSLLTFFIRKTKPTIQYTQCSSKSEGKNNRFECVAQTVCNECVMQTVISSNIMAVFTQTLRVFQLILLSGVLHLAHFYPVACLSQLCQMILLIFFFFFQFGVRTAPKQHSIGTKCEATP